jgi:hypothetical protein
MDLGLQVDPVASATSVLIMLGFFWGYMNMVNSASKRQQRRNSEDQILQNAKVLVLAGKMDPDRYQRAVANAEEAKYVAAKKAAAVEKARVQRRAPTAFDLPRLPRLPRVRASLSNLAKQDDQEQLLQDFKDHLHTIYEEDGSSP